MDLVKGDKHERWSIGRCAGRCGGEDYTICQEGNVLEKLEDDPSDRNTTTDIGLGTKRDQVREQLGWCGWGERGDGKLLFATRELHLRETKMGLPLEGAINTLFFSQFEHLKCIIIVITYRL